MLEPGDIVECVGNRGAPQLAVGSLYTVEDVFPGGDLNGWLGTGVSIREVRPPAPFDGFDSWFFKPVYRPEPQLLVRLLERVPVGEREVAC